MVKILQYFKAPYQRVVSLLTLTLIMYVASSGIFSIPMNETTIDFSRKAGGLAFYAIGGLFVLTVVKSTFLELVENSSIRSGGQKFFSFSHQFLGWIIFTLATYHSLFYFYYYLWPVDKVPVSSVITGIAAIICLGFVIIWGRKTTFKVLRFESAYFRHVFATIVLILLTILHLNFL